MHRSLNFILLAIVVSAHPSRLLAQTAAISDAQATALAAKSMTAMTGGLPVGDATLTANVIWIAGSDNLPGTATLQAKGPSESRVDLRLGNTTRSEIRTTSDGSPQGAWSKTDTSSTTSAALRRYAPHNCWTDAAWFFPALSSLAQTSNASFVFSYVGQERHGGINTQHLKVWQVFPPDSGTVDLQRLTTTDFYLDPASLLPVAIAFKVHADKNTTTDIPMEIRFADYQVVNGVRVPFHIQRMLNGGLVLDVVVTNAAINSGLQDSSFNIQ